MNKKLVVIGAAILLLASIIVLISGFMFGLGGSSPAGMTSNDLYESRYTDLSDSRFTGLKSQEEYSLSAPSTDREAGNSEGEAISLERKIISTAHIQLEVDNIQSTLNTITNITIQQGGYISGSSASGYEDRKTGQVTLRVPQKNFYTAVEQIEALGTVKSRQVQGQDVTEEYIDISARLGNLQKQEDRLNEILKMATTVKDVLEVEKELERVRGEIERLTGRKNYLEQSIEMSTISVNANEPAPFFEGWGITNALKESVNGFFNTISGLIVFTGYIIPIAIYLIIVILIGMGIKNKVIPRLFGKQ